MCTPGFNVRFVWVLGWAAPRDRQRCSPENVKDSGRMPMPKDVRPSRPESVTRTRSVDMVVRALLKRRYGVPKSWCSSNAVQSHKLVHSHIPYSLSTHHGIGHSCHGEGTPSTMHLPVIRCGTQAARLIISSLRGSPISVKRIRSGEQRAIEQNCHTLFFKSSKSWTSKRSSLPLLGSLRSDAPPFL
jgi:hypothetical protein